MKGLNVRVLAILVGTALFLGVGTFVVHYFQMRNTADDYLVKARALNKSEDLNERRQAIRYYGHYLGQHSKDTDAQAELGMLYADLAQYEESYLSPAFMRLEQVLRDDDLRDDVRRKVVELAMRMHQGNDAVTHLDILQNHDPNNGELYELRAKCQITEKDYVGAKQSYESAITLSPDLLDAYVGIANLLRSHADEIALHTSAAPGKAQKDDTAKDDTAKDGTAKDDSPKEEAPKEGADKTKSDQDGEVSEDSPEYWMNKMVERNPKVARAYFLRANYFRRTGQLDKAQGDIDTALKLASDDQDILLMAVRLAIDQENYDEARKQAERAVKLFSDSPRVYQVFNDLELRLGNREKARQWIEKGLEATEQNPALLWEKANLLLAEGKFDDVRSLIQQIQNTKTFYASPALISYLEGQLAFAEKEWTKASAIFEGITADLERMSPLTAYRANQSLYKCYEKLNQPERAKQIRDKLRMRAAARPTSRKDAWRQLLNAGQLTQAIAHCRKMLQGKDAQPEGWIDLTTLLIRHNERLPQSKQNWVEVEEAFNKAKELNPNDARLPVVQAQLLLRQQKLDEAITVLEEAVKKDPTNWNLWDPLIVMAQLNEDWDRAAKLIDQAEKYIGMDTPDEGDDQDKDKKDDTDDSQGTSKQKGKSRVAKTSILLARARLVVGRDGSKASEELRRLAKAADEIPESGRIFYLRRFATHALQANDVELAKECAQKVAKQDPADLKIRILLAEIAGKLQDEAAMKQAVDEIGTIEQKGPLWHFYTAQKMYLFDKSEDKTPVYRTIIQHLDQARMERPGWSKVLLLLAEIHDRMGEKNTAIENYRQAVELGSRDPRGLGNLVKLLYEEGEQDEARQVLRLLEQTKAALPLSILIQRGADRLRRGDITGGASDLQQVVDKLREVGEKTTDFRLFVELSRNLRILGKIAQHQKRPAEAKNYFDEAEKALHRATDLSPDTRQLWIELVVMMANSGKIREVSEVLNEAKEKLPPEKVSLTLAQCYEVLRRLTEAELEYEKAYQEDKNNKNLARLMAHFYLKFEKDEQKQKKGEAILRDIVNGKRPAEDADIPWARRKLAVLLSKQGSHKSYHEAMKMVDANLKQDPDSILDKRLKARLLAQRPSRTERKKALAIYEELVQLPKPSPSDRYELARMYFVEEQWNKANQQMRPLMTLDKIKPEWLDFYIRAQIRAGEYSGAEAKLNRYESMIDNPFRIAVMRARILSGRGRHVRAIRVIQDYVDNATSSKYPRPTRVGQAAQALDNITKHVTGAGRDAAIEQYLNQAEQYYREQAKADSSRTKLLVSFLGNNGRRDEALEIAEEAWEKDPSLGIVISAVSLLSRGNPTPGEVQRIEKIVNGAVQQNDEEIKELSGLVKKLKDDDLSSQAKKLRYDLKVEQVEKTALLLTRAELLSFQKHYDEAEKLYRTVLAEDPDNLFALNNLAVFLSLRGLKIDEALQMINKTIELGGPTAVLLDSRATVYLAKGKWREALDDMRMALAEEPTAIRYFHQAQAYAQGGDKREARRAMKLAEDYGLKAENLQPLERPAYRKLKEDLK